MFTGIIQSIGRIVSIESLGIDSRLKIDTGKLPMETARIGDSIAVDGVCLTVIQLGNRGFTADVSVETLLRTTLKQAKVGSTVNLETALTPTTRLGGHFVSGHIDGVGEIVDRREVGRSFLFIVRAPVDLAKYIAEKGSICVNGISLTVNRVNGADFEINIVPHTLSATTLGTTEKGRKVNLEIDLLARYLERLLLGEKAANPGEQPENCSRNEGVTKDLLMRTGFMDER